MSSAIWKNRKQQNSQDGQAVFNIPNFDPRPYQLKFLEAMDDGCKRAVLVWHRRAGKEVTCFNWLIKQALWHRVGTYVYFFPTSTLGRRILWDGANKRGERFMNYLPSQVVASKNSVEMKVTLVNGSIIQIIGSDQILNVGINPVGCVFSEFSLQDPACWNYVRPILRENGGWAVMNFTPRGKNHAYELFLMAKDNPDWFCQKLAITDTDVLSEADMQKERDEGMSEDLIQQEYYCSFDQGVEGAYYAKLLAEAENDGRVEDVRYEPHLPVDTFWDLGVGDETVVLFTQNSGNSVRIIDLVRNQGVGLQYYVSALQARHNEYGYIYGDHWAPHDIQVREFGSGAKTRLEIAKALGVNFRIVPNIPIADGIEHSRAVFKRVWISRPKCKLLLKALDNYHKHYNEKHNCYADHPVHDWSSHYADAFRYMAVVYSKERAASARMSEEEAREIERAYASRYQ